jgi:DNA helicase II / ATP-dependent DNA helicase PcrA
LLQKNSQVGHFLQKRFKYVFVDEMQDMAPHQQVILERIFGPESDADSIYQRIGDTDQAIFSGTDLMDTETWKPRARTLNLSNSQRLSSPIARILAPFAYQRDEDFEVIGNNAATILPHLLLYDDDSASAVVGRYAALIKELILDGSIPVDAPRRYMAIAWNCEWTDAPSPSEGKRRLIDFCPTFQMSTLRKQEEFEYLADYLAGIERDDSTLRSARSAILRAICRALRISKVLNPQNERTFTSTSLIRYVRFEASEKSYARLNRKLLSWSIELVSGETHSVLRDLQKVIPKLISHFNGDVAGAKEFLEMSSGKSFVPQSRENTNSNSQKFGNIQIDLGTVHSVKGQTHTATLYIESSYHMRAGVSYESQRLAAQFKGERLRVNAKTRVKESAKMVYVGFSRPTHLLVFAVHQKHYDSHLSEIDRSEWKVIYADEVANDKPRKQNGNSL